MSYSDPEGYEAFMGRWSARLAPLFLRFAGLEDGQHILDVGCGTGVLARAALADGRTIRITGVDPVESFIAFARRASSSRAEFQVGSVEALPFPDGVFDATLGLLVLQEFAEPDRSIGEMVRVTRPFGRVAACQWDFRGGMPMMAMFWEAATALAPDEVAGYQAKARPLRNADLEEFSRRWMKAGLSNVRTAHLEFRMPFRSFEEFWLPFRSSATPFSAFAAQLDRESGGELERLYRKKLQNIRSDGSFELSARALVVSGQRNSMDGRG
ncbi:class I SAM-dependent methyltransferase [Dongia deserti]|uniref:class I SAM-dependent methyltransferase n=1 Tax=Dongia deserti TaxID=2268030 RepID=UPI0013C4C065|nr:methyltransferase domain-containing protein [Dongia deserti]